MSCIGVDGIRSGVADDDIALKLDNGDIAPDEGLVELTDGNVDV